MSKKKTYRVTQEGSEFQGKYGKFLGMVGYGNEQKFVRLEINGEVRDWHPDNVTEIETIDLTPTWPELVNLIIALIEGGNSRAAREHLTQMAQVAQMYVDLDKKGLMAAIQLKYTDLMQYGDEHELIINLADGQVKTVRLYYHGDDEKFKQLFTEEPELSGQFNQNKLYTK